MPHEIHISDTSVEVRQVAGDRHVVRIADTSQVEVAGHDPLQSSCVYRGRGPTVAVAVEPPAKTDDDPADEQPSDGGWISHYSRDCTRDPAYRFLAKGEAVQAGDEYWVPEKSRYFGGEKGNAWHVATASVLGCTVATYLSPYATYRRKLVHRFLAPDELVQEGDEGCASERPPPHADAQPVGLRGCAWGPFGSDWFGAYTASHWGRMGRFGSVSYLVRRNIGVPTAAPEPVDPGYGYRLLAPGESIVEGDEVSIDPPRASFARFLPCTFGKPYVGGGTARRRIDAGPGYQLVPEGDTIREGDEWLAASTSSWVGCRRTDVWTVPGSPAGSGGWAVRRKEEPKYRELRLDEIILPGDEYRIGGSCLWLLVGASGFIQFYRTLAGSAAAWSARGPAGPFDARVRRKLT